MKSRIISKLFLNFSRKKPKEKSKKRIETSEHHVARIHRFFEQREDDGQIRQCGRLRIHVPVRPDLSSAYGRSGAQVHVTHPPPHPPLSHRCPSNPLLASRFSLHGEAKREQRDRVLKHRRIVSIGEEKDRIGQPCKPANRGIRTGNFVPRPPKRAFGRESRATDFRFHPPRGAIPRVVHPVHQDLAKWWIGLVRGRISCPFDIPTLFAILLFRLLSMIRDHGGEFSGKNGFSVGCGNFWIEGWSLSSFS